MDMIKKRMVAVFMVLTIIFVTLLGRAVYLQIFPDSRVVERAKKQYTGEVTLSPRRGDVFDRNGNPLAISIDYESLFADPKLITDKKTVAEVLNRELGLNYSETLAKISNNKRRFVWLKHLLSPDEVKRIDFLFDKERGLRTVKEPKRVYPNNTLAAHVVGFANRDAKGMDGVEYFYDEFIKNRNLKVKYEKDRKDRPIYSGGNIFLSGDSGNSIYLTIDNNLQYMVERELRETVEAKNAASGTVIVMKPQTGEILALANYPAYDPNEPAKHSGFELRNRAVTDLFEPGSIFKIFTAGMALKNKVVDYDTKIWGENGRFHLVGGRKPVIIKEAKGHDYGSMTITDIIAKSSNIGSAKLGLMIGEKHFYEGVEAFGFGRRTDVDLPGEINGIVNKKGGKVTLATSAFGQGISVTAMQIMRAYSIIANGGYDVVPHVVKRIENEKGERIHDAFVDKGDQIIPAKLAKEMVHMLRLVVEEGTGTATDIMGFEIAGKTGTAQKAVRGGYSPDKYAVSFAGMFPASNPQYTMLVLIDEPKGAYFAGVVAVPLFKKLAKSIIHSQSVTPKLMPVEKSAGGEADKKEKPVKVATRNVQPHAPGIVPDLRGLSLRQALTVISNNWSDVNTYGSGKVVRQDPVPGGRNPDDKVISIWLE